MHCIEVTDEIVKNTKIRHAFDLSRSFKKNSCLSDTSSTAAEVVLRRMSDEGDPEWHSDGVDGSSGLLINRLFRRISNRDFWNYKMDVLLPFLTLRSLLFYVYL